MRLELVAIELIPTIATRDLEIQLLVVERMGTYQVKMDTFCKSANFQS
jgi:hypothetical protein